MRRLSRQTTLHEYTFLFCEAAISVKQSGMPTCVLTSSAAPSSDILRSVQPIDISPNLISAITSTRCRLVFRISFTSTTVIEGIYDDRSMQSKNETGPVGFPGITNAALTM